MSTTVFLAVLLAALLHATWNAVVKGGADKVFAMSAVVIGKLFYGTVTLLVVPFPDLAAWPYILASIALHVAYQLFLVTAYRFGDLSQVYPLARGSAPLIVAAFTTLVLGVTLDETALAGVGLIAAGLISLALVRKADGQRATGAAALALIVGLFIAAYSIVDGLGARAAGTGFGFYAVVALGNAFVFLVGLSLLRRGTLLTIARSGKRLALFGSGASYFAYALVVWAFTQAPIAVVTALRETSIVFAVLIGVVSLKERLDLAKVAATLSTIVGAVILRGARL
ncbi:MAG: DMT family transporter [Pseudomonadota bacterium]